LAGRGLPGIDRDIREIELLLEVRKDILDVFVVAAFGRDKVLQKIKEDSAEDSAALVRADTASCNSGWVICGVGIGVLQKIFQDRFGRKRLRT
jgi:hypothetical protein